MKVNQQAYVFSAQTQIGNDLCFMNWDNLLHTFELHNDQIVYQEIYAISQIDANALLYHG